MPNIVTPEEHERERLLFEAERKRAPELFLREPMVDDDRSLARVGIDNVFGKRPVGYLKFMPQDFIVEEISKDGGVHTVELESAGAAEGGDGGTFYADLVKVGIGTLEAKAMLAEALGIEEKNIGYAGIKDRLALTSQTISIRGLAEPGRLNGLSADNFFLKDIRRGKGVMANGDLKGNKFTITLRTPEPIGAAQKNEMERKLEEARADGFWNFFYFQRFGTPRLISHLLGLLLIKGKYEEVVRTFLTYRGARELPYFMQIRDEIGKKWGDWRGIKAVIDKFPYHFHLERAFVGHLVGHPDDFLGALHMLPDQVRLWMYAYDCFLFNCKLSELIGKGEVPLSLPFVTSFNPEDWKPYAALLEADEVRLPSRSYKDFPFIRVESRRCATLQRIDIHGVAFEGRFATFSFSLPKGSYATTFLMNFFVLASGLPIVPGIPTGSADPLEILKAGTLSPVLGRFKAVLDRRAADIESAASEE